MRRLLAALCLVVLPVSASGQQLWLAQNDNTTYGNLAVGWPASVIGFRFTAPSSGTVAAAQVFTGNAAPASHTLELRAHDAVTGLPGLLLGSPGTWTTLHTRSWQGCALPQNVALVGGQDYWLVWRVTGMFHQHSVSNDATPGNVLTEVRISDGNSWHGQAMLPAKFRLFAPYPAGTVTAFGTAKPGTYGDPQIGASPWPSLGSPLDLWLDAAARRQPAFLVIGIPLTFGIPLAGIGTTYTTGDQSIFVLTNSQSSPLNGGTTITLPVPNDPGLAFVPVGFQWAVLDPLAADGISHTAAVEVVLQ